MKTKTRRIFAPFVPVTIAVALMMTMWLILSGMTGAPPVRAERLAAPAAPEGDALMLELVSQTGGQVKDVAMQGDYLYLGVGPRLHILDISDAAHPVLVGKTPLLGGNVGAIEPAGEYVYAIADGLQVISVADPAHPIVVGRYDVLNGNDIDVAGDYLYLTEYSILHVLSITDPTSPTQVGRYGGYTMRAIEVVGDYAYIAGTSALPETARDVGLVVISLADRSQPVEVGFYETPGVPEDLYVAGDHIYVASVLGFIVFDGYLSVFEVPAPGAPQPVAELKLTPLADGSSYASSVYVAGNYAYLSADYAGMAIVSVADPAHPVQMGHCDTLGRSYDIVAAGDHAYLADDWGGLRVISVADRNQPQEATSYVPPASGYINSIHVADGYAYLGGGYAGLWVVSVADPAQPAASGYVPLSGGFDSIEDVYALGDYVYAADVLNGLKVFDVADKAHPTLVGRADTILGGEEVHAAGGYAYLATDDEYIQNADENPAGLYIFDVRDPARPTPRGHYLTDGRARGVDVVGAQAYVAVYPTEFLAPGGLNAISVANPDQPTLTGFYTSTIFEPQDVQIVDDTAYMAGEQGLWTFSLADPSQPALLGIEYGDIAKDVHVVGERAYLTRDGVSVVSVADPTQPVEVAAYEMDGTNDLYVVGEYVYVANGSGGMAVLRVTEASSVAGRVVDGRGDPIAGARISAGGVHSATTDANGVYTITGLLRGTYTLTPTTPGYFWSPAQRTVAVPPAAEGQDFVGRRIQKRATPSGFEGAVSLGDRLTYTLRLISPEDVSLAVYDPLPTHTQYINGSLSGAPSVGYDAGLHAISGTVALSATTPLTITFGVQVRVMGTVGFAPQIVNRACIHPPDGDEGLSGCEWSNQVVNYTYLRSIYLPLVTRQ